MTLKEVAELIRRGPFPDDGVRETVEAIVQIFERESDYTLRDKLEAWRKQIEDYDPSKDFSPGPLYGVAMNNARGAVLNRLNELIGEEQ